MNMTFHERSAWIMTILLVLIGGWYLNGVWQMSLAMGETAPPLMPFIAVATVFLVIGAIISHTIAALIDPESANEGEDERDKQVMQKSGNLAGYVLGFGCFAGLWHFVWLSDGNMLFHIIVASLIASQIAEYVLTILYYRRGG